MESKFRKKNKHGRGGHGSTTADSTKTVKSTFSMVQGIPVLYPPTSSEHDATKNGVQIVKEALINHFSLHYGRRGRFIADDEYFVAPMPDAPDVDYDPHDIQSMIFWDAYKIACAEVVKEGLRVESEKVEWFALIVSILSPSSKDLVEAEQEWEDIEERQDPLELWRIIERTHLTRITGSTDIDRYNAMEAYNACRQERHESISEYKRRFERAVSALERVQHPDLPIGRMRVIKWIRGLNDKNQEWKNKVINLLQEGGDPPDSLEDAVRSVRNYVPMQQSRRDYDASDTPSTVFVAKEERTTKGNKKSASNDRSDAGNVQVHATTGKGKKDKNKSVPDKKVQKHENANEDGQQQSPDPDDKKGCYTCGKLGHTSFKCPLRDQIHQLVREGKIHVVTPIFLQERSDDAILGPMDVLLDDGANVSVYYNEELLSNIRDAEYFEVSGIGPGVVSSTKVGDTDDFGTVRYMPEGRANVLCFDDVADLYPVTWDQANREFRVETPSGTYTFKRRGKLYVCDFSQPPEPLRDRDVVLLATVSDNEKLYCRRDVVQARRARDLEARLAYVPAAELRKILNSGAVIECPVTSVDVSKAEKIYGAAVPGLKGRTVRRTPMDGRTIEPASEAVDKVLHMHMDVMYVNSHPFLLGVFMPINLTVATVLEGSSRRKNIRAAVEEQLYIVEQKGFFITTIHCDNEFRDEQVNAAAANRNINFNVAGPGQHEPVSERKIRLVKERTRAVLHSLPYSLPSKLLRYLVLFVVFCLNIIPVKTNGMYVSPKELLTGRKVNYKRDLRFQFGEYIQATTPNVISNSMQSRTDGDIALLSTGNVEGTIYAYNLATNRVVKRDRWQVLPIPDIVIQIMNKLADEDDAESRITRDPTFRIRDAEVTDHDENADEIDGNTSDDGLGGDEGLGGDDAAHEPLVLRIPKQIWNDEARRNWNLELDEDVLRDDDGDIVMDLSDSHDYVNLLLGHSHREHILQQSELNTMSLATRGERVRCSVGNVFRMTVARARKVHGDDKTLAVLRSEVEQIIKRGVCQGVYWEYLTEADRKAAIRCSVFIKEKYKPDGLFDKLKARLVAGGDQQDRTVYSDNETSSPTVSTCAVFIIAAIAAKERRQVATIDFAGAYLNADMKRRVLMTFYPVLTKLIIDVDSSYEKYVGASGKLTVRLDKALYGCIESAKLWYDLISSKLLGLGFIQNPYDICVFNKEVQGIQVTTSLYVDDLMITCADEGMLDATIEEIQGLFDGSTVNKGKVQSYLGMIFDFESDGLVSIKMDGYIEDIINEYGVSGTAPSPAGTDLFNVDVNSENLSQQGSDQFHSRVAKLLYMAKRARPDLLTAVGFLATRVSSPTQEDWKKLERTLRYVNGTRNMWLTLSVSNSFSIEAYIDASYGVHADGKGHTGVCITIGSGFFYVASTKQKLVSKSSTEAELIGVSDGLSQVLWVRNFLLEQGYTVGPAIVWQDNKSTIAIMEKGRSTSSRTKHINVRYFFITDRVRTGEVSLKYKPTEHMVADLLTKPVQGELFRYLRSLMLGSN